jgi:hypothetical protein
MGKGNSMNNETGRVPAVAGLLVLTTTAFLLWACAPQQATHRTVPINIGTVQVCQQEDGTGDGQDYPCRWDCRIDGNHLCGPDRPPVTLYVDEPCPKVTQDVLCIDVRTWETPGAS